MESYVPDETACEDLPYCFLPGYKRLQERIRRIVHTLKDSETGALISIATFRMRFLHVAQFLCPPLLVGSPLESEAERDVIERALAYLRVTLKCDRVVQPPPYSIFRGVPANSVSCPFGSYVLDLREKSEDELFQNLHPKNRNVIRSSEPRVNVAIGIGQFDNFYRLYESTMQRELQSYESYERLHAWIDELGERNLFCGVVADSEGPLGSVFAPYTRYGAYYLFGGTHSEMRVNGAMNFLLWQAICFFTKSEVRRLDFVGARIDPQSGGKHEGLQRFKSRFGSTLHEGYLWKTDLQPGRCRIFDALNAVKQFSQGRRPPKDLIDQERTRHAA